MPAGVNARFRSLDGSLEPDRLVLADVDDEPGTSRVTLANVRGGEGGRFLRLEEVELPSEIETSWG